MRLGRWHRAWRALDDAVKAYYQVPFRRAVVKARRDEDDLFMLLLMSESLGVPNPATYYTLELLPLVYDRFHDWHRRMGMERSPLDDIRCC